MEYMEINFHAASDELTIQTRDMHSLDARRANWLDTATTEEFRIQGGIEFINQCMKINDKLRKLENKIYTGFEKANELCEQIETDSLGKNYARNIAKFAKLVEKNGERMTKFEVTLRTLEQEVGIETIQTTSEEQE